MRCKIFIRWGKDAQGRQDSNFNTVELVQDGKVVQHYCNDNHDRIYGYCNGIVETLSRIGVEISMPICLTGRHLCADTSRED